MYTIYMITNTIEGKSYIGCTSNLRQRWKQHFEKSSDSPIVQLLDRYTKDDFVLTVLADEIEDRREALDLETSLIKEHNTLYPNGYNRVARQGFWAGKKSPNGCGITATEAVKVAWANPESREKLMKERKERWTPEYQKLARENIYTDEWRNSISRGLKKHNSDPANAEAIKARIERTTATLNTVESVIKRRNINQKYSESFVAKLKGIFHVVDYYQGFQTQLHRLIADKISLGTLKDIRRGDYYSHVEPDLSVREFVELDSRGELLGLKEGLFKDEDFKQYPGKVR